LARIAIALWRCGRCGKPRGLHHACSGRRGGRDRFRLTVGFRCASCGKTVPSLLAHTCSAPSDFRRRKAARARAEKAAERKRKRLAAASRRRARARERRRLAAARRAELRKQAAAARRERERSQTHDRERHEPAACEDAGCPRYPCQVYREGAAAGFAAGEAQGYAKGYAAGMSDCPLPHQ
jgi:hypothetical protein